MTQSVSVVTPSYNQAEYIEDTIISVSNQTYEDITHHVIDGGSDDGTIEILKSYRDVDWISEPDRGQTHAINKGFTRADGDIIGWLNSDDPYVYKSTVSEVLEAFESTKADLLYGHAVTIDRNNRLKRVNQVPRFDYNRLERHCFIMQPSVFFRSSILDEIDLNEDRDYSMDYEFWLDIGEKFDVRRINKIIAADRNHDERKIIKHAQESAEDTRQLRQEKNIYNSFLYSKLQSMESVRLRSRRVLGLRLMMELISTSTEEFAFCIKSGNVIDSVKTQLVGDRKEL